MPRKQVVVELSPTRLEVATLKGGRVRATATERLEHADWSEKWPGVLSSLDEPLGRLVAKLGVRGASTTLLYAGSTSVNAVFSCPAGAGGAAGQQAAALALAGLCTFPLDSNPHAMWRMASDGSTGAPATGPQSHTLAIADSDESISAVVEWLGRAGLHPAALMPLATPATVLTVRTAMDGKAADPPRAVLCVGEHGSILAAGHRGRLLFVRALALGTESLVEALCRPIRLRGEEGRTVVLDRDAARHILETSGIPPAGAVIDPERGIDGAGVLPLIQPILQRLAIETKQSLRFGLSEEDRAKVRLTILGPGAGIARLGEMLARQCGVKADQPAPDGAPPEALGNIAALAAVGNLKLRLTPRSVERAQAVRRVRTALWVGAAASLMLIGAEWFATGAKLLDSQGRLAALKTAADARRAQTESQDRAVEARTRLARLEQRVSKELGEPADWAAVLWLLGQATSPKVQLTDIELGGDGGAPYCRVNGYMLAGVGSDPAAVITRYIDDLSAVPIVKGVRLGATQRVEVDGGLGQRFELGVKLVALPPGSLSASADEPAAAGGGGGR